MNEIEQNCDSDGDSMEQQTNPMYDILSLEEDNDVLHNPFDAPANFECDKSLFIASDRNDLENDISALNANQNTIVIKIYRHYNSKQNIPLRIFIRAGAGTGKSFLLRTIVKYLQLNNRNSLDKSPVIVCEATSIAVRNIQGTTIHSTFKLPVQKGYENSKISISPRTLQT